jgi:hypothetical protein
VTAHVPALPDFTKQFQLETDVGDLGVGVVLMQTGHPLAFISRALGHRTKGLSTFEKEYLAILIIIDQWKPYLQLAEFVIFTNQRSLTHPSDQRLHTYWQQKMFTKLIGLQYKIVYKRGSDNRAVDALSRHPAPSAQLLAIWLHKIQKGY